ncbi:MAG: ElyC/SanA/YdcF family protein [Succiniclasticum sp.]|jgi:hypothetical protein|nr:ElyC/SanA/YdcF family protein [Succiniclasticum sp.]MEE3478901.1 ElyC/SanA/YdcF family protein [Succiniclasticum sp.]
MGLLNGLYQAFSPLWDSLYGKRRNAAEKRILPFSGLSGYRYCLVRCVREDGGPGRELEHRLDLVMQLAAACPDMVFVLSGRPAVKPREGSERKPRPADPDLAAQYLERQGLPARRIVLDDQGWSVFRSILSWQHLKLPARYVILAEPSELVRAFHCARHLGMDPSLLTDPAGTMSLPPADAKEKAAFAADVLQCLFNI